MEQNQQQQGQFQGYCNGGPYNGQVLAYDSKQYFVAVSSNPPLESYPDDAPLDDLPRIGFGCYRFILGKWMWLEHVAYPGRET
jgi:hypothetical protein